MKVPYVNLAAQWEQEREQLLPIIDRILSSGAYIGGESIERFEAAVADYCGVEHAVALQKFHWGAPMPISDPFKLFDTLSHMRVDGQRVLLRHLGHRLP